MFKIAELHFNSKNSVKKCVTAVTSDHAQLTIMSGPRHVLCWHSIA